MQIMQSRPEKLNEQLCATQASQSSFVRSVLKRIFISHTAADALYILSSSVRKLAVFNKKTKQFESCKFWLNFTDGWRI